jgi:hypothetical protein
MWAKMGRLLGRCAFGLKLQVAHDCTEESEGLQQTMVDGRAKTEKKKVLFFIFQKAFKHMNSNTNLNSSNQK